MKFGPVPIGQAVGAIAAHSVHQGGVSLKKGEVVGEAVVAALAQAGVTSIIVARLEPGDVDENEAARRLADAVAGANLWIDRAFTGRANLFAAAAGVFQIDAPSIDRINVRDEAITIATLPANRAVVAGEMVATVKIIPFAVSGRVLDEALRGIEGPPLSLAPYRPLRVGIVSTLLPGLKDSVIAKTLRIMEQRLAPAGASIVADVRVPHQAEALAGALERVKGISDVVIVFGASAITDRRDVIPAALLAAGGTIEHFGMPVDPGNLLLLGDLSGRPVLGAPGCARSPKENGFDWVLQRILAGLSVTAQDIRQLGVGGLLMEIVSRPQPRAGDGPSGADREADDE